MIALALSVVVVAGIHISRAGDNNVRTMEDVMPTLPASVVVPAGMAAHMGADGESFVFNTLDGKSPTAAALSALRKIATTRSLSVRVEGRMVLRSLVTEARHTGVAPRPLPANPPLATLGDGKRNFVQDAR